jgi:hypothetical protein
MPAEESNKPDIRAESTPREGELDRRIAELAGRQHGVVSRAQLYDLGLRRRQIGTRIDNGRLHSVHAGVYAVGHRVLTENGRRLAAVLAAGDGAVLSHRAAGALWGLIPPVSVLEVTAPRRVRRPGIRAHRSGIRADERTVLHGFPVTTVARTLLDLATVVDGRRVERALEEAEARRLGDRINLAGLIARYPGCRGVRRARLALARFDPGSTLTRSELEERFLRFVDRRGLPRPLVNTILEADGRRFEVDCLWRAAALVVELDSRAYHASANAFETDRARDRALNAAGWTVVRVTWRQLRDEPVQLATDLRRLLCCAAV